MKIHFIGIGGIGVSALAQYYFAKGHKVSGSDLASSEITDTLEKKGIKITIGKEDIKKLAERFDLVIYSPAVKVECSAANLLSYPAALGELTKKYFTIAVSGTHGKSTTTAMLGVLLVKAGLDPTVIVGTKVKEFNNSNYRAGNSKYLVIEADEHFASFLNYWPKVIILTNIEKDHLDYYKNYSNVLKSFRTFVGHLPKDGVLITNQANKIIFPPDSTFPAAAGNVIYFSLGQEESKKLKKILKVPGEHNLLNSLAALNAARALKVPDKVSFKALSEYGGCWRRFEISKAILKEKSLILVSDYGHHPTETSATLKAAREKWPKRKIWCVFQPHQYQRTYYLFNEFVTAFKRADIDRIIITDIYSVAGRESEKISKTVSSEKLVKKINSPRVIYLPKNKILGHIAKNFPEKGVLIIMGAGDIYGLTAFFHKNPIDTQEK